MDDVIFDQKKQRRRFVIDAANTEGIAVDMAHHMRDVPVIALPQVDQFTPITIIVVLTGPVGAQPDFLQ